LARRLTLLTLALAMLAFVTKGRVLDAVVLACSRVLYIDLTGGSAARYSTLASFASSHTDLDRRTQVALCLQFPV